MADFKTHIAFSTFLGAGYGTVAHLAYDVHLPTCILAGGLCAVSGMLPDLDSHSGTPLRESIAFAAAVVPMMLVHRLQQMGMSNESMVLAGGLVYLLIRFGLADLLKRFTRHRGMFHSLPAAVIAGELAFLLASGPDLSIRLYKAAAVVLGYASHLVLDELFSVGWRRGRLRLKHSFGTALKLFGSGWWPNLSAYLKLAVLTLLVLKEPGWAQRVYDEQLRQPVERTASEVLDRVLR